MNNDKPQLHVSMLDMAARCGIQFQRRYGYRFDIWPKEEIIAPAIAQLIGTNVHVAAERDFTNKIENGELLSSEAICDISRTAFEAGWVAGIMLDDEEALDIKGTHDDAVDQSIRLSLLHHSELAPNVKPLEVEKKFVLEVKDYPLDLAGTMDIVGADAIGDIKTMGQNKASVQSSQMAMYATAFKIEKGEYPKRLYHHKLIKTKQPKAIVEEITPDQAWITPLYRRIERLIEIIDAVKSGKQAFMPADPGHWCCTRKFCGYSQTCKFWSGK